MTSDFTLQYSEWRSGLEFAFLIYCGIGPKYASVIEMDIQSILIVYSIFYNVLTTWDRKQFSEIRYL